VEPEGVYVPMVTPFRDGSVDFESHERLLGYLLDFDLDGIMMFGTTGERLSLIESETRQLVERTLRRTEGRLPLYLGVAGASTAEVEQAILVLDEYPATGYLVGSPYYMRPNQDGLIEHYRRTSAATAKPVLIYNIPFRTAVNVANETVFELSEVPNIVGIKDVCGDLDQTFDLLARRRPGFSVLAGEDPHLFAAFAYGADGAVLASAHVATAEFVRFVRLMRSGDLIAGRDAWRRLLPLVSALFTEPSPMGIKYALWRMGIITSPECRLPLTTVADANAAAIDHCLAQLSVSIGRIPA
jgi:4-hydroxy-tetrahydrodipicolinate synthase